MSGIFHVAGYFGEENEKSSTVWRKYL